MTTNKRVQIKILSILKVVSFESLAGNDFSERGTQAEAHFSLLIAKETSVANCEVLDEKHRIAVQGTFVSIIMKAGGASLTVTD